MSGCRLGISEHGQFAVSNDQPTDAESGAPVAARTPVVTVAV